VASPTLNLARKLLQFIDEISRINNYWKSERAPFASFGKNRSNDRIG